MEKTEPATVPQPHRTETAQQTVQPENFHDITDDQKQQFVLSVIARKPYAETIYLFNGSLKATFTVMHVNDSDVFAEVIVSLLKNNNDNNSNYKNLLVDRFLLASVLSKLQIHQMPEPLPVLKLAECKSTDEATKQLMDKVNAITKLLVCNELITAVSRQAVEFLARYRRLAAACASPDFWKPIQQ